MSNHICHYNNNCLLTDSYSKYETIAGQYMASDDTVRTVSVTGGIPFGKKIFNQVHVCISKVHKYINRNEIVLKHFICYIKCAKKVFQVAMFYFQNACCSLALTGWLRLRVQFLPLHHPQHLKHIICLHHTGRTFIHSVPMKHTCIIGTMTNQILIRPRTMSGRLQKYPLSKQSGYWL